MRLESISHGYWDTKPKTLPQYRPSLIEWYRILRGHYHWTVFESIRYALWLWR